MTLLDKLTEIEHYCENAKETQAMSERARWIRDMILEVVKEVREMVAEVE